MFALRTILKNITLQLIITTSCGPLREKIFKIIFKKTEINCDN